MRFALLSAAALAACTVNTGGPPPEGGGGILVDEEWNIRIDEAKVPLLATCGAGKLVRRGATGTGWECVAEPTWATLPDKPDKFPPADHTHTAAQIAGLPAAAVAAMGAKADGNPLNHDRYTDPEAVAAVTAGGLPWTSLTSVPATFPPSAHGHVAAEVSDFNAGVASGVASLPATTAWPGTAAWSRVTGAGATTEWPGTAQWARVSGKPADFPPSTHTHGAAQVTDFDTALAAGVAALPAATAWPGTAEWSRLTNVPAAWPGTEDWSRLTNIPAVWPGTLPAARVTYASTVLVGPVGTAAENGAALLAALAGITGASATAPRLLKIEPGVYDIGTASQLTLKPFVDIEGSGEKTTKITRAGSATDGVATIQGANDAELRFLTVENTGGAAYARTIYNAGTSPRLVHVTVNASGATGAVSASVGITNVNGASPAMVFVSATGTGGNEAYGIINWTNASPSMVEVRATATNGLTNSVAIGNYISSSPYMQNVTATASRPVMSPAPADCSGGVVVGVNNGNACSPRMINVESTATGGPCAIATNFDTNCNPLIEQLGSRAGQGAVLNWGFTAHNGSAATVRRSLLAGQGTTGSWGVVSDGTTGGTSVIEHSIIIGATGTLSVSAGNTVHVAGSRVSGGPTATATAGTVTCSGVWDEGYVFSVATCPN